MTSKSVNSMLFQLSPRTLEEEQAQLLAAIAASLHVDEGRNETETGRSCSSSETQASNEDMQQMIKSRRHDFVGDRFSSFDKFYPQKRLVHAKGELC
jgi:hypothetical protein